MVRQQRTVAAEVELRGIGLHTGEDVTVRLKPAKAGHGVRFLKRTARGEFLIPADLGSISEESASRRNTTLHADGESIHTVEHLLGVCYALQLDNLLIELEGSEPPEPLGGNYAEFVSKLKEASFVNQGVPCEVLEIGSPVTFSEGSAELCALPYDEFRISFTIAYDNEHIGTQYASYSLTPEVFESEISPARTFVLWEDVEHLRTQGLIKGGSLDGALVFKKDGLLSNEPLRFSNECVRHKILDLLGDLSLIGVPIKGHVQAIKSGHSSNLKFARELRSYWEQRRDMRKLSEQGMWDINIIQKIMPHRYPFLLVDRIIELEDKKRVVGIKNVTINEPFFVGHFPGHPIMPAVLIIEAMAQVGGVLLLSSVDNPEKYLVYFSRIDKARFRKPVLPGDQLRFELEMLTLRRRVCKMQGLAYVGEDLVAEAELLSTIVDR